MSRCFPFPPPGYLRNGPRSDALIQSIKLRTDMEKAKKDRKEKKKEKKEKKEKRREEKEKKKEEKERKRKESLTSHSNGAAKKFKLIDEIKEAKADGKLQKVENEQVERSVITEELDQPVSSREPCTSDSSQNSKRKRGGALVPSHDHGGPDIRIRLPLRKHTEPENSKQAFQLGSSGNVGVADSSTQDIRRSDGQVQCTTNVENNLFLGNSHSRDCNALPNLVPGDIPVTNVIVDDEGRRMASLYNSLCQIQIPLLTYYGFDSADQDWLFSSKPTKAKHISKKPKTDSDAFQCSKSLWPVAQYLPEVEIYALPYTVPF